MPVSVLISRDKEGKLKQVINLKIRAQFWLTALGLFYSGQKGQEIKMTISCLIFRYYCRVHYVKYQAGWITSWNQDCLEKYQQLQICRWYNSNGRKKRWTKEPLDKDERGVWKSWLQTQHSKTKILVSHLEEILESPLGCRETSVNPKGNQPWIFIWRTDAEADSLVLCHLMWRADSLEKTLMQEKIECRRRSWDG